MARLLSQQEDFKHQVSMLETFICNAGHECNPIEMVSHILLVTSKFNLTQLVPSSIGAGASTTMVKSLRRHFKMRKTLCRNISMPVPQRSFAILSIGHGDL
jgi:hypothetical protein